MRTPLLITLVLALVAAPLGAAQLYRWVDEKGRVEWRDTPPPANATQVEKRSMSGNTVQTSTLPYSLQQAVKNFPVTLWASDCGEACSIARNHLARRGIPYTERDAQKDTNTFKKVTGTSDLPVLIVGTKVLKGYLDTEWDSALDAAGYPRTAMPGVRTQSQSAAKAADPPKPAARQP